MSEPLYKCFHCLDVGIIVRERKRSDGVSLGTFGSPCLNCVGGDEQLREWSKNGLKTAARETEIAITRMETLLKCDDPETEASRWRAAARAREVQAEERRAAKEGPAALGAGISLDQARRPSDRRSSNQPHDRA